MNFESFKDAERIFNTSYKFTNDPKLFSIILEKLHASLDENTELSEELKKLINLKQTCSIEFTRCNKRIICDEDYNLTVIDEQKIKEYLEKTKLLIGV
jgi:hypothetical protein